jgi:hypothetical protein
MTENAADPLHVSGAGLPALNDGLTRADTAEA